MNKKIEDPKWWRYLAMFLLTLTASVAFFCLLNILIMESSYFASFVMDFISFGSRDPLGKAINFFAILIISFSVLFGLLLFSIIGIAVGFYLGYTIRMHLISSVTSVVPIGFLLFFH